MTNALAMCPSGLGSYKTDKIRTCVYLEPQSVVLSVQEN